MTHTKPFALFVQDQLKIRRWTVNAGLRYDQFRTSYNAIHLDPVRWLPVSRDYPGAEVLNWKDLSRRLGVARPVRQRTHGIEVLDEPLRAARRENNTNNIHPVIAGTNSVSRTWTDSNRDFVVQEDPLNPATNSELGPSPNSDFGFNSNNVLRMNGAYGTDGAAWARSQAIVPGRLLKLGAQVSF